MASSSPSHVGAYVIVGPPKGGTAGATGRSSCGRPTRTRWAGSNHASAAACRRTAASPATNTLSYAFAWLLTMQILSLSPWFTWMCTACWNDSDWKFVQPLFTYTTAWKSARSYRAMRSSYRGTRRTWSRVRLPSASKVSRLRTTTIVRTSSRSSNTGSHCVSWYSLCGVSAK